MEDGLGGAGTRISTWAILGLRRPLRHLSGDVKEASGYEFTVMKKKSGLLIRNLVILKCYLDHRVKGELDKANGVFRPL